MTKVQKISVSLSLLLLGSALYLIFKPDVYIGFFYPDSNNLTFDITSEETFTSIYECRAWAELMALDNATLILENGFNSDYECGKNCDLSGGKPYVCEETLQ